MALKLLAERPGDLRAALAAQWPVLSQIEPEREIVTGSDQESKLPGVSIGGSGLLQSKGEGEAGVGVGVG